MVTSNKKSLHNVGNTGFSNTRKSQVLVMLLICMWNRDHSQQKKFISSVRGFAHTLITQPSVHIHHPLLCIYFSVCWFGILKNSIF